MRFWGCLCEELSVAVKPLSHWSSGTTKKNSHEGKSVDFIHRERVRCKMTFLYFFPGASVAILVPQRSIERYVNTVPKLTTNHMTSIITRQLFPEEAHNLTYPVRRSKWWIIDVIWCHIFKEQLSDFEVRLRWILVREILWDAIHFLCLGNHIVYAVPRQWSWEIFSPRWLVMALSKFLMSPHSNESVLFSTMKM